MSSSTYRAQLHGFIRARNEPLDLPMNVWGAWAHVSALASAEHDGVVPEEYSGPLETVVSRSVPLVRYSTSSPTPDDLPFPPEGGGHRLQPTEVTLVRDAVVRNWFGYHVVTSGGSVVSEASSAYWPALGLGFPEPHGTTSAGSVPELFLGVDDVDTRNYCHFVCDILPKFSLASDAGSALPVLLDAPRLPYHHDLLPLAARRNQAELHSLEPGESLEVEYLYYVNRSRARHPLFHCSSWAIDYVRSLVAVGGEPAPAGSILYISRERRQVLAEDAVLAGLRATDLQVTVVGGLEALTVVEQARLFSSHSLVMGPHGAAFTNVVFRDEGPSSLLEVVTRGNGTPAFALMSAALNIDHHSVVATEVITDHPNYPDLDVDVDALVGYVTKLAQVGSRDG